MRDLSFRIFFLDVMFVSMFQLTTFFCVQFWKWINTVKIQSILLSSNEMIIILFINSRLIWHTSQCTDTSQIDFIQATMIIIPNGNLISWKMIQATKWKSRSPGGEWMNAVAALTSYFFAWVSFIFRILN